MKNDEIFKNYFCFHNQLFLTFVSTLFTDLKSCVNKNKFLKMKIQVKKSKLLTPWTIINSNKINDLKRITPKQILQILPIVLVQVKTGNASKNSLNEIVQTIYSFYQEK